MNTDRLGNYSGELKKGVGAPAGLTKQKTYEHVGAELLFELVGLCEICHQATHKEGPNPVPTSIKILEVMNRIEADRLSATKE